MRKFYLILLFLWLIIGYFICKKYICNDGGGTETSAAEVVPSDDDCSVKLVFIDTISNLNLVSNDNFQFEKSNDKYLSLDDDLKILLANVVSHLGENPNTLMQLKGYYLSDEVNSTEYENLGLARANAVKAYFLEQGANSDQIKTIGKNGNQNCMEGNTLRKGIAVAFGSAKR
jgi:OmpA-OmpF porin, OOP family